MMARLTRASRVAGGTADWLKSLSTLWPSTRKVCIRKIWTKEPESFTRKQTTRFGAYALELCERLNR